MRADMGKVLVERPRIDRWAGDSRPDKGYRKRLQKCLDAGDSPPRVEGIKEQHRRHRKFFNEHLGPLRKFLDANVGRPWDKIYSEICAHINRGNVVQKHILTHLFDYVVTCTVLIDGEPCRGEAHYSNRYGESLRTSDRRHRWYVCPKSGLLRKSRYVPWEPRRPAPPRVVRVSNKQACVERAGRWELVTVTLVARSGSGEVPAYGMVLQGHIDCKPTAQPGTSTVSHGTNTYSVSRRVLTRKELFAMPIPIEWLK